MPPTLPGRPVVRDTLLSMIAVAALGITRLLFSVIMGRHFGPRVLGVVNTQISLSLVAGTIASGGTSSAAAKFVATALGRGRREEADEAARAIARVTVIGTAVTLVVLGPLLPLALHGQSAVVQLWTFALTIAYAAYSLTKGLLYGRGSTRTYTRLEVIADAVVLAAAVGATFGPRNSLVWPLVLGYSIFAVAAWQHGRPRKLTRAVRMQREWVAFTSMSAVGTLTSTGFLQLSMVFARHYASSTSAGYFASALSLIAPAYFLPRALTLALFPSMAHAHGRGDAARIRAHVDASTRILMLGLLPAFGAAELAAPSLLRLIYGTRFGGGTTTFEILLAATYVSIISVPAVTSLTAVEQRMMRVPTFASVFGFIVGVGLWTWLGPIYGAQGVALGYLLGSIPQSVMPMATAWRRHDLRWGRLTIQAAVVLAFGSGLFQVTIHLQRAWAAQLVAATALTVACAASLWPLRHSLWRSIETSFRR